MEEWRAKLATSIQRGFEEFDEDKEWEQELSLEAIALMVEDSIPPPEQRQYAGSRLGRQYVYHEHGIYHEHLYQDEL
jgi:hypothetical protein